MSGPEARAPLTCELAGQRRLLDCIEVELEADDGGRGIGVDLQGVLLHGKHGEDVAMRTVALRRARTAIARRAEVGARLQRALGQQAGLGIAGIELELGRAGRDVHHHPVPEAAARRRIGIEAGDGKALGVCGRARPRQMRRLVAAAAAEAVIGRQDVVHLEGLALLEAAAAERERHGFLRNYSTEIPLPLAGERSMNNYSPCPPATEMVWPVTHAASGEARNSATLAISSAWPMRPNGIEARVAL